MPIRMTLSQFAARCRGVECSQAVIRNDGEYLIVEPSRIATVGGGPGTHLKQLLARIGITATPTCSCNARARVMDARGCGWCEANLDSIVGWLREEAAKRKLPFLDAVGKLLVRRAIRNARKEQTRATKTTDGESGTGSAV